MGKGLDPHGVAGASASAEGERALRTARRRRKLVFGLLGAGVGLAVAGVAGGAMWLGLAAVAAAALAWRWRPDPDPDRWRRGSEGEVATARMLDLLPRRFVVLHDRRLGGTRGNLDHVVIGPTGVWVVDSKVRRAELRIHRGQVLAGRVAIDAGPAAAQASRLESALGVPVRAVVAVHGAGLRRRGKRVDGVLVLPAARLIRRLRRGRRLSRPEVRTLAVRAVGVLPTAEMTSGQAR